MNALDAIDRVRPSARTLCSRLDTGIWPLSRNSSASERQLSVMMDGLRGRLLAPPVNRERFHAVFVDRRRAFLGEADLGEGCPNSVLLSLRDLFARALSLGAEGMIMAHNHPSGDCRPSSGDVEATLRIAEVAKSLEIELIDHLIFTEQTVYSMRRGDKL